MIRQDLSTRIHEIAQADFFQLRQTTDRMFAISMIFQLIGVISAAWLISPYTWIGIESNVNYHIWSALSIGTLVASLPVYLAWKRPGHAVTRHTIAVAQMLFSAMLIHFTGGRIETHFHIFGSLAFLAFYLDWRVLITATVIITIDHSVRGSWWPQSVYGILTSSPWRTIEHCVWVFLENIVLIFACFRGTKGVNEIARREAELEQINEHFEQLVREKTDALAFAVNELSKSNSFLKATLDAQPYQIVILDPDGSIKLTNSAWKSFWFSNDGTDESLRDKNYLEVCESATGECRKVAMMAASKIREILSGLSDFECMTYACHSDTENRWFTMELTPFQSVQRYAVMVQRDVTERYLAEEAIQIAFRENAKLAEIAENTTNAVVLTDANRKIIWVNKGFERITGYSLAESIGQSPGSFLQFHGSDQATVFSMRQALRDGKPFRGKIKNRAKNGREYWLELDIQPRHNLDGSLEGFMAIESDITDLVNTRLAAESSLSEVFALRVALDQHSLLSVADRSGKIVDVNAGFCRISGYSREELIGQDHHLINSGHHPKAFWRDVWRKISNGEVWRGEICNRAKDGTLYWVDSTIVPRRSDDGKIEKYVSLRFDITDRKRNEEKLQLANEQNRLLATAVERSPGATVVTDVEGVIEFANSAARTLARILHHESEIGMKSVLFSDGYVSSEMQARIISAVKGGRVFHAKIEVPTQPLGSRSFTDQAMQQTQSRWLQISASPLTDETGVVDGIVIAKEDITDEVNATKALEHARELAELSNRSKSEFLANMSHEIRTPMTAILGFTDLLESEDGVAKNPLQAKDAIHTIRSNANHLLSIINDILDMSKIEAGKMTVEAIDVNPARIVEEVASLMRPRAIGKGLVLRLVYENELPEKIQTDPTRLRQVLLNLVGNAIKFTEMGEVVIRTSIDCKEQRIAFRVDDTGVGMSPEQCYRISRFEAFSQADNSMTRQFGGTGLGLRISNSLTKLLGGGLSISSELGKGSSVTAIVSTGNLEGVSLLVPHSAEGQIANVQQPVSNSLRLAGLRILLAEDGPDNQRLISFHLRKAGAVVEIADNGKIAVDWVQCDPDRFHLIFMDMQMPEVDGYKATQLLREWGYQRPIIALTAHAMEGDRQNCLKAGCDEYTTKPIDRLKLVELAEKYGSGKMNQGLFVKLTQKDSFPDNFEEDANLA